ncbi:MAG: ceramidase domain-containing protein [Patescibacteria group bacterium]
MRGLFYWLQNLQNINWKNYRSATCYPNRCFCELIRNGFVRQPVNAYSNLIYILVGIFILFDVFSKRKKSLMSMKSHSFSRSIFIIYGLASVAVGIGSFFYHASFTYAAMQIDVDSMYLVSLFILLFLLFHIYNFSKKIFIASYISTNIIFALVDYFIPGVRRYLFAFVVLLIIYVLLKAMRNKVSFGNSKYFIVSIISLFIAYVFWIVDNEKIFCNPTGFIQGHAIWHVLNSLSILCMYFYMQPEYLPQQT